MRDVVVIGGGLSGLSACFELEKRRAAYTVIEVKRRFGGGIRSTAEAGFLFDACAFAIYPPAAGALPAELELQRQIHPSGDDSAVFRQGTETLVRAFADRLGGGRLMRMAVSSVGRLGGRFTICLENGIMLDAGALILALPARYAARALWNLAPAAAQQLARFRYDSIRRVSLGYHKGDLPDGMEGGVDDEAPFSLMTDLPGRVPDRDHRLIQVGLRNAAALPAEAAIGAARSHFGWGAAPLAARVDVWREADLHSDYGGSHRDSVSAIRRSLPAGISLIGSDYCLEAPYARGVARLDERIQAGRQAARDAVEYLSGTRRR